MKKIAIMTTGGDCSGLNNVISRLVFAGMQRGHKMFGILDGTDGLASPKPNVLEFGYDMIPAAYARLSGSILRNGHPDASNYRSAAKSGKSTEFQKNIKRALERLGLDAVILLGGNGSISLANSNPAVYSSVQLVVVPKTIDMDIPLTDVTIGFNTAVSELVKYGDQLLLTARSHHRWFVVQTMGRDSGFLCLHAGVAAGASAILLPETKWKLPALIEHIKKQPLDYGLIFVAEGCKIRGRSGQPAEIIRRDLEHAGISARAEFPEHLQRSGDTCETDRILAAQFCAAALDAIENNETMVATVRQNGIVKTVPLLEIVNSGVPVKDPNVPNMMVSNEYVSPADPLIKVATNLGVFI